MNTSTSLSETDFQGDASLGTLLAALRPHAGRALVIEYAGRTIRPGYHVTEVKAGSFTTLDCGGNPDTWRETILQIEDLGPEGQHEYMTVEKFRAILDQVGRQVALDPGARLTFEVGQPDEAMRVFDVASMRLQAGRAVLRLLPRPAICKPRHRAEQAAPACCDPKPASGACCAA